MDALAMTEPDAGSDVRSMKCAAVRDGGDWVLNGSKHFISGAEHADFVIVFVATGEDDTPKGPKKSGSPPFWSTGAHRALPSVKVISRSAIAAIRT